MNRFKFMCCGCSLVHRIKFKVTHEGDKHVVWMKLDVDKRATAAARRAKAKTVVVTE